MVKKKEYKKLSKKLKVVSKKIIKKGQTTYTIPKQRVESVWEDDNKFFKGVVKNEFL